MEQSSATNEALTHRVDEFDVTVDTVTSQRSRDSQLSMMGSQFVTVSVTLSFIAVVCLAVSVVG